MNDFYSLLKQSIIDRDIRDGGARDEVYAQARKAMIRQLWAYQPALPQDDIDRRIENFDDGLLAGWKDGPPGDEPYYGKRPYQPMPLREGDEDAYARPAGATSTE